MITIKFLKSLGVVSAAVGIGLSVSPLARAATINGFTGAYAPTNWTLSGVAAILDTSNAPNSITLTIEDNPGSTPDLSSLVNYTVTSAGTGSVAFDYSFQSEDSDDYFRFFLNGTTTDSPEGEGSGGGIVTGNFSQSVNAGDEFGFELYKDTGDSSPSVTVSNFSAPAPDAAVPFEFSPSLGLLSLCAIFGADRMRKLVADSKKLDTETAQSGLEEISIKH